jgi:hypothetical protein
MMKERKLIELISLPEPEAARFELRPDGGRTLILEMGLLTEDEEISMSIGLIRRSPVQLIAVRLYPSSQDDIVMLYMVQLDQDPPEWPAEVSAMHIPIVIEDELLEEEMASDEPPLYADTVRINYGRVMPFHEERDPTAVEEFVISQSIEIDPIGLEELLYPLLFPLEMDDWHAEGRDF